MDLQKQLLALVDEDTLAFNRLYQGFSLPDKADNDRMLKLKTVEEASKYAAEVPFKTMERSLEVLEIIEHMMEIGNPNSITDATVEISSALAGFLGGFYNVQINLVNLKYDELKNERLGRAKKIIENALKIDEYAK